MDNDLELSHWFTYNNYLKGNLDNLTLNNKGKISFRSVKQIELYDSNGKFYKNEYEYTYVDKDDDIEIKPYGKTIVQIDYDFYLVPIPERLQIQEGRFLLTSLLIKYGIKGIRECWQNFLIEENHYSFPRTMYKVERPLEIMFSDEYRLNTKSFMNFNYDNYILNYEKALTKYPNFKKEIDYLKKINIEIICDFYKVTEKQLKSKRFDRLTHAIKILNYKINNN
jgi:hypothetical protein